MQIVGKIKKMYDKGRDEKQIAKELNVKPASVYKIIKNLGKIKFKEEK